MSNDDVLRKRVARLLADTMSLEVPSVDTDLFEDGLLDSLGFVELLANLEREFGVTTSIDDMSVDNFNSIAHIAGFVAARTASTASSGSPAA